MLKDITTINVQGANFASLTKFVLFDPKDGKDKQGKDLFKTIKGALIYGRNGTGKSTIAKAFRKAKGEELPTIKQVSFLDKDGSPITLSEEDKDHIFIFDEDFVNEKVKLKEDHLDTIIMLGQAADLAEKIELAEKERDSAKIVFDTMETTLEEFADKDNPKSPQNILDKIAEKLRGDDSWAGRDKRIRDKRHNTQVRDDTYKIFVHLEPKNTYSELIVDFDNHMKALVAAKAGSLIIDTKVPSIPERYYSYDDKAIISLLAKKIEKPKLNEREQFLLSLVQSGQANNLTQKASVFKNPNVKECPYCFQPLSDEYKSNLVASIEKVLTKSVEDHRKSLEVYVFDELIIDLSDYSELPGYKVCIDLINHINNEIQANNELIQKKINCPYQPIEIQICNISDLVKQLAESLEKLEHDRIDFNSKATDTGPIIKRLTEINSHIAHYDVAELAAEFDKQQEQYEKAKVAFKDAKDDYDCKIKELEDLEAQRQSVHVALDIINACLKYIFFADDRLKIDYSDGEYRLLSYGKSVRPCDVSVGERNIIGLSYFFASIMEGQEEKDVYDKEYLLIIDDPVSSFDSENRIGILSFLKYELGLFLEGNEFSKAFIMTHDLMTFYDIHKLFEEIIKRCKKKGYALKPKFNRFELADGSLVPFNYKARQEYTEILKLIYDYGKGDTKVHDLVIGNLMRQALEAFATFQYKKGIEEISTDPEILNLLPEPEYRTYYENLMYRLVLHGGSHKEEQVKAMKDYEFFSLISEAEKQRTAKEVLCFIYLLNKPHVLQHLQEIGNVETTLDNWCSEVKARAAKP